MTFSDILPPLVFVVLGFVPLFLLVNIGRKKDKTEDEQKLLDSLPYKFGYYICFVLVLLVWTWAISEGIDKL